ncbi:MAG: phosphate signaling complex protein PhoU [Acidimicrobiia bacterium]
MDVPQELRVGFHKRLDAITQKVVRLFALVTEGVASATDALLGDDAEAARRVAAGEAEIDGLMVDLETELEQILLLEAPVAGELRYVLSVIRIVPELERSGDLAEHIAKRSGTGLSGDLPPAVRGIITRMSEVVVELWRAAADAFVDRDAEAYHRLELLDDQVDALHGQLTGELIGAATPAPVAAEIALLARFYERLGDHAVHMAKRLRWAVLGPAA